MITVGIRELKQQASELIRRVRENGSEIQITYRGKPVALLIPMESTSPEEEGKAWTELDQLAAEIGARWPTAVTSIEAVSEVRQ